MTHFKPQDDCSKNHDVICFAVGDLINSRLHGIPMLKLYPFILYLLPSGSEQHEVLQFGSIQEGIIQTHH